MRNFVLAVAILFGSVCSVQAQNCENGMCTVLKAVATAPIRVVQEVAPVVREIAMAPVHVASDVYQEALASAQYRAANRIHGHSPLDMHRTSGVGWASSNSTPTTCLGAGGPGYAVVQGSDGWYATKLASSTKATSCASQVTRRTFRVRR